MPDKQKTSEEEKPFVEELDFNKPDYKFKAKNCHYKQQGYYLICQTCEIQHAVYIGPDKRMVGEKKDGTPILQKIDKN